MGSNSIFMEIFIFQGETSVEGLVNSGLIVAALQKPQSTAINDDPELRATSAEACEFACPHAL